MQYLYLFLCFFLSCFVSLFVCFFLSFSVSFCVCFFLSFLVSFFLSLFLLFSLCFHYPRLMWPVKGTSSTQSLTCFLSLTPTRWLMLWLADSFVNLRTYTHSPTHLPTYSLTHLLALSFSHPFTYLLTRQIKSVTFLNFDSDCRRLCDDNYGWRKSDEGRESSGRGSLHSSDERGAIINRVIYFTSFTFRIHAVKNWLIYCDFFLFSFFPRMKTTTTSAITIMKYTLQNKQ